MPFKDVTELRRAGRLEEAFTMAMQDLQRSPDDIWSKRALFWVLYEYLKREAKQCDVDGFFKVWEKIKELDLINQPDEAMSRENVIRCVKTLNKGFVEKRNIPVEGVSNRLLELFDAIEVPAPGDEYSLKIDAFLPLSEVWSGFPEFVEQKAIVYLRDDVDFNQRTVQGSDGRPRSFMSLAESTYIAYTKAIMKAKDVERMRTFQPELDRLADLPNMSFLGYFNAKLLQALHGNTADVLREVLSFARRKRYDYWVWQFLSELFADNDEERHLACLLRASHCQTSEDFLPKIRVKLANIYFQRNDFPRLKYQAEKYVRIRLENGYRVDWSIQQMMNDSRYVQAQPDDSDPIDYLIITNRIIGARDDEPVVRPPKNRGNSRPAQNHTRNNNPSANTPGGDNARRTIEGEVTENKAGTAMFVKADKLFAFIPPKLREGFGKGDRVEAEIEESFDPKRNQKSWACTKVTKKQ